MDQPMIAGWAATIGSSLFVVVFTLEGLLRPGYHPRAMHVSALSLGPRGWIQKANFIVLGFLLLLAAWGIGTGFPGGGPSRAGLILLGIVAFLFVVSGVFVMDPAATPQGQATASGIVHGLAGGIIFLLMPITMFVFLRGFGLDPGWGTMPSWTLGLGTVEAVAVLVFIVASRSPRLERAVSGWIGLIQRAALVPFMVWLFVFGVQILGYMKPA